MYGDEKVYRVEERARIKEVASFGGLRLESG